MKRLFCLLFVIYPFSDTRSWGLVPSQLNTIHDITCGPTFRAAALELLKEAKDEAEKGLDESTEPVIMVLETLRRESEEQIAGWPVCWLYRE